MGIFTKLKKAFNGPTSQELAHKEAHSLNSYILDKYSLEEQSMIIKSMGKHMLHHRVSQIEDAKLYLERLEKDKQLLTETLEE